MIQQWQGDKQQESHLLATVKTASVATRAFSFSPKVMTGLKARGFRGEVNLLRDTTRESITYRADRQTLTHAVPLPNHPHRPLKLLAK